MRPPAWLDAAVRRSDWYRRPPSRVGGAAGFKEWQHFCVYGDGFDLLVNLSEVDPTATSGPPVVRLTTLGRRQRWVGDVDTIPAADVAIHGGRIEARVGDNRIAYADGRYQLRARSQRVDVAADLQLVPLVMPAPVYNVATGDGPPIHWVVLPRLSASGEVRIDGETITVDSAPAYHDHNWGHFRWGRDFAWEWGFGLPKDPSNPWSFVFARLSNRALNRTRMQTLFLWKGTRVHRAFRDDQVRIRHVGLLRPDRVLKVPSVMGIVSRGRATDIPAELVIEARSHDTTLSASFRPTDVAQVILPNDDDLGVTIINEVAGRLDLWANADGEQVSWNCDTVFEFLGA